MITNYLKIAWRNLQKNTSYSIINIAGLSVGMAVALLIGLWIYDEISFDRYHKNHSRVGQVFVSQDFNNKYETDASIVVPLGNALRTSFASDFKRVALSSWNAPHKLCGRKENFAKRHVGRIRSAGHLKSGHTRSRRCTDRSINAYTVAISGKCTFR